MILKKPNSVFGHAKMKGLNKHYDNTASGVRGRKKKKAKLSFKQRKLKKKAEEEYEPKLIRKKQCIPLLSKPFLKNLDFEGYEKYHNRREKKLKKYLKFLKPEYKEKDRQIWKACEVKESHIKGKVRPKHKFKILDEYMDDLIDKAMKIKEHTNLNKMKFLAGDCIVCHKEETKEFKHCD